MKKLLFTLAVLFTSLNLSANCDFSGITFKTINQQGNNYYFQTNMHSDSCWYYTFTAYSFTNKEEYKLDDMGGWTGVTFNQKGKYEVRLNVFNECEKCDTVFTIDVDITVFNKLGYTYDIAAKNCKYYTFELEDRKDECYEYYYQIYKADDYINGLSDKEWKELDDSTLYFTYSWAEELIEYYSTESERVLDYEFKDSGRYFILPMLYNKCTSIDTWAFKKLNVCLEFKTLAVKDVVKTQEPVTILKIYDLLGREADEMVLGKIYVILYSDGRRQKVIRTK